jgi:hypothetical protein
LRGGNPNDGDKPKLLLAAEKTLQRWVSLFVFSKHESAHENG